MVQASAAVPAPVVIQQTLAPSVAMGAATDASIAAYIAAGERMRILAGWVALAGVGVMLIVAIAWALGVLPVAVRLV